MKRLSSGWKVLVIGLAFTILAVANALAFGHHDDPDCMHCAQATSDRRRFVESVSVSIETGSTIQRFITVQANQVELAKHALQADQPIAFPERVAPPTQPALLPIACEWPRTNSPPQRPRSHPSCRAPPVLT